MNSKLLHNISVLLVEDNEMNRLVASTIVQNHGASVTEAENGKEALELLQTDTFHLVIMDIHMPVMNGLEASRYIRENISASIPIIALTANALKGENDNCIASGMNDYLTKPFREEDLIRKISDCLRINMDSETVAEVMDVNDSRLYDLSMLESVGKGNREFITRMLNLFIDQVPVSVNEMKEAFESQNLPKIKSIAHRIKPSIDNMGIISLKEKIRNIESIAGQGKGNEELKDLIDVLDNTISKVIAQLVANELS